MRTNRIAWMLVLAAGCGGGGSVLDDIDESEGSAADMQEFAGSVSAASVYAQSMLPLFVASLNSQGTTPCPVIVEGDTVATYDGGCTDDSGNEWFGHAEATASGPSTGPSTVEYDGFGFTGDIDGCPGMRGTTTWNGSFTQTPSGTSVPFDVALRLDADGFDEDHGCVELHESLGYDYSGTWLSEDGPNGDINTFEGHGRVGTTALGYVTATTDTEVLDDSVCGDEALSGTTTMAAGGHTAVITYDGATDCDPESTVTWTYDGADQGELTGVSCSSGRGRSGPVALLLVLGAVWLARRRTR